jgi:hypothetical protein
MAKIEVQECLFLGGCADGLKLMISNDVDLFTMTPGEYGSNETPQLYRRRILDTLAGPIPVFTHKIYNPVRHMLDHYANTVK